jgi:hypothetical protein
MARWRKPTLLEGVLEQRRQSKDGLIEIHPNGSISGGDPRKIDRAVLQQAHPAAPLLDVIREKCLDCCCYQPSEVDQCTAIACSLWPYRFGTNPFSNRKGNPDAFRSHKTTPAIPGSAG